MKCPVCGDDMRRIEKYGANIDICPGCKGMWLDRGELEKMLDLDAQGGPDETQYYEEQEAARVGASRGELTEAQEEQIRLQREEQARYRDEQRRNREHEVYKKEDPEGSVYHEREDRGRLRRRTAPRV